jgi:hypothetical protein
VSSWGAPVARQRHGVVGIVIVIIMMMDHHSLVTMIVLVTSLTIVVNHTISSHHHRRLLTRDLEGGRCELLGRPGGTPAQMKVRLQLVEHSPGVLVEILVAHQGEVPHGPGQAVKRVLP